MRAELVYFVALMAAAAALPLEPIGDKSPSQVRPLHTGWPISPRKMGPKNSGNQPTDRGWPLSIARPAGWT